MAKLYNPPPLSKMIISNFAGGINQAIDPIMIKNNESPSSYNCFVENGNLETAKGYEKFITYKFTSPIDSMIPFYNNTEFILLVSSGKKLYKVVNGTPTVIKDNLINGDFDFINYQVGDKNVVIISNGYDPMMVYNGTTIRNVLNRRVTYNPDGSIKGYIDANGTFHNTEATVTTLAPKCKFIELHYDRIWGAGDNEFRDRLYFSTAGVNGADIDDWTSPIEENEANQHGGFEEMPTWDGGKIIGIKNIFDDLVVFKEKQIFKIFGSYPGNYQKVTLFTSSGAISDRSIITCEKGAYFLNYDGIYYYDGTNVTMVSAKVKNIIENVNKTKFDITTAIYYDNKYYLSVPMSTSTTNNSMVVLDTDSMRYDYYNDINANDFIEFNNQVLFCSNNGYIYKLNSGTTYDGKPISMYWSSYINAQNKNVRKMADYFYFIGSGNGQVSISCLTERKIKTKIVDLTATDKPIRVRLNNNGRSMQIIIENVNGSYVCIKQPELTFEADED